MENGSSFTSFGGVREESIDPGGNNLGEFFREKGVFEPFEGSGLRRSLFF